MLLEERKRLEVEKKAQEKYKAWLQKKQHEEKEKKLKEQVCLIKINKMGLFSNWLIFINFKKQEELARREKEERERKERADEKFKEWLKSINDKERHKRQSSACSASKWHILFSLKTTCTFSLEIKCLNLFVSIFSFFKSLVM